MANESKRLPKGSIVEVAIRPKSESDLAKRAKAGDGIPDYTVAEVVERFTTLKEAKEELNLAYGQYVRRILKKGDLEGIKVKLSGGERWLVTKESISYYETKRRVYTLYRNYTLRIDPKDEEKVRKYLKGLDTGYDLELQYIGNRKEATEDDKVWARAIESLA